MIFMNKRVICQQCKYYFITWEKNKPHGCKAYGFKSLQIPAMVVKKNSGMQCGLYENKFKR